ncbi:MAG: nicotinic acid mononucleotide adenyltransferase [Maribacter sp.]|nr:nicotinic acid mononucleotide adenyltransferase [Maribacter sp.]
MKALIFTLAVLFSISLVAQSIEPKFEQEGNNIKGTYFHENGQIAQTGYFVDGKLDGIWKMYDENGQKIAMGKYTRGKKTGKWFFWEGKIVKEVDFDENKIANVVEKSNTKSVVRNN